MKKFWCPGLFILCLIFTEIGTATHHNEAVLKAHTQDVREHHKALNHTIRPKAKPRSKNIEQRSRKMRTVKTDETDHKLKKHIKHKKHKKHKNM